MLYKQIILISMTCLCLYLAVTGIDFSLDDAWIHLAYAKSLKLGEGLSYNPYDYETGASSPLWVLILAAVPWFGHPLLVSKLLCIFCFIGSLVLLQMLLVEWFPRLPHRLIALLVLCGGLGPLQLQSAVSGMAVSLTSLLWLAALVQISRNGRWVGVLVFLSVAARAELLVFWGIWSGIYWLQHRNLKSAIPALSAGASLGLWMLYCYLVSGHWFPNTKYVKDGEQSWASMSYLPKRYLFEEPILLSGLGVGLILYGLYKCNSSMVRALALGWVGWVIATALTRSLDPNVLFFQSRYFAPLGLSLVVFLAAGLSYLSRPLRFLFPILGLTILMLPERLRLIADQEEDIYRLHTQPAFELKSKLPPESVVLIEGAGAHRFWLSRDMWLLDVIGLNHQPIAHMTSFHQLRCYLAQNPIDFAVLPRHMVDKFMTVYALEELMAFEEPQYHQAEPPFAQQVFIFRSHGIRTEMAQDCIQ